MTLMKNPMTPSGIKPATFLLVAQCLNELPTAFARKEIPNVFLCTRADFAISTYQNMTDFSEISYQYYATG
jgi:hypothetical protein